MIEAIRLLVERTENREELFGVLLASLRGLTKREREAALYYLSRFGSMEQIPAIKASVKGFDDKHYHYSVKCTVNQIRERFEGESDK